ncbi:hypothetical protein B0H19DRAFT_1079644 [Mycena capillaripes]|nr:hypothetical protein B0H19DRAFT_1079644 [Mycena capillaripes]
MEHKNVYGNFFWPEVLQLCALDTLGLKMKEWHLVELNPRQANSQLSKLRGKDIAHTCRMRAGSAHDKCGYVCPLWQRDESRYIGSMGWMESRNERDNDVENVIRWRDYDKKEIQWACSGLSRGPKSSAATEFLKAMLRIRELAPSEVREWGMRRSCKKTGVGNVHHNRLHMDHKGKVIHGIRAGIEGSPRTKGFGKDYQIGIMRRYHQFPTALTSK